MDSLPLPEMEVDLLTVNASNIFQVSGAKCSDVLSIAAFAIAELMEDVERSCPANSRELPLGPPDISFWAALCFM